MAIVRLALSNPAANTNTLIHTAERQSLVSVLAANKSASAGTLRIWVQPQGSTTESQYAYITYDTVLPVNNTLETFRFSLESGDQLYVRSSIPNVSFSLNAIYESSGNQNIVTSSPTQPTAPTIGDVWVNTNTSTVYFWSGSSWITAAGSGGGGGGGGSSGGPFESQVLFSTGSASAPSITFIGDTNTGIYSPGADSIAIAEGGVQVLRINSDGSINITGTLIADASSASRSGFRLTQGISPTSPTNGDIWATASGIYSRINNKTNGPLIAEDYAINASFFLGGL